MNGNLCMCQISCGQVQPKMNMTTSIEAKSIRYAEINRHIVSESYGWGMVHPGYLIGLVLAILPSALNSLTIPCGQIFYLQIFLQMCISFSNFSSNRPYFLLQFCHSCGRLPHMILLYTVVKLSQNTAYTRTK